MVVDTKDRLESHVRTLAHEIGERNFLHPERLERAALYIETSFHDAGYLVRRQPYQADGRAYRNILAERPGEGPLVLVGAHYDTAPGTPGADDNASGVAVLLELAHLARDLPQGRPLRFAAFSTEEPPFFRTHGMGSWVHAQEAKGAGDEIEAMLCLEMLGYYDDRRGSQGYPLFLGFFYPPEGDFIAVVANLASRALMKTVASTLRDSGGIRVKTGALPSLIPGVDFSDHRNFWKAGYKAVMLTDTAFYRNPRYHAPDDTPESLDYARMEALTRGLLLVVDRLARPK